MADKWIFSGRMSGLVLLLVAFVLGACVSQGDGGEDAKDAVQPAHAIYRCDAGATLTVEKRGTSIRLTDPDGEQVELPPSPPSQRARYGETPYALVLEGREALYMKSGEEPLTCKR